MKHLFIINSQAAASLQEALIEQIRDCFQDKDYVIEKTAYPKHATKIAKAYTQTYPDLRIYACGGDGTIHEVLNGIYPNTHVQLAIVPIGTGNDFIKSLGYTLEDLRQLESYEHPLYLYSDLILTQDEVSINTVSLGLDVVIADNVSKFKHLPIPKGTVPYYLSLLYSMISHLSGRYILQLKEEKLPEKEYSFIVFGNGQYYGGGYRPCPQACIDDGKLDYCLIKKVPRTLILNLSNKYKQGTHLAYHQYVSSGRANKIQILNQEPVKINLDGEVREMFQPSIELLLHQIQLCLPQKKIKK